MNSYRQKLFSHSRGMTMIEIMIVVSMIGGLMALSALALFRGDDSRVREEAGRMAGTIKYIYNEAAIKNKYYRLALNLDENSYYVESNSEPFYVSMGGEEDKKTSTASGDEGGSEGEEGTAPPAFAREEGLMVKPVKLKTGVKIKDVTVMHKPERVESGKVYTYFLPNGWAEPFVINLSDEGEESFYSLQINPITGKSVIRGEYLEVNPETFAAESGEETE